MNKVEKCPYCDKEEFAERKQNEYASIALTKKALTLKSQVLYHLICLNYDAIVKSYVKEPKKLVTK